MKIHYSTFIAFTVYLFIGCTSAHKNTRAGTQTLIYENYLNKVIPVSINFQGTVDEKTNLCSKVCLSFQNTKDQVIITTHEDYYCKDSKNGVKKTVFREPEERAYYVSDFEAQQINKCNKVLTRVLKEFDACLESGKWEQSQGLDSYLMRFLKGFNFLVCSATNNTVSLFSTKNDPESVYNISVSIGELNARVNHWRIDAESRSKLQTVTKALLFQCRIWEKNMQQKKNSQDILINDGLIKATAIFMRIYLDDTTKSKTRITGHE